jgi:hypothetical protein
MARRPERLASAAEALEIMQQAFGAYRAVVADLSSEARAAAWSEVGECLKQLEDHEGFHTELEFIIGSVPGPFDHTGSRCRRMSGRGHGTNPLSREGARLEVIALSAASVRA